MLYNTDYTGFVYLWFDRLKKMSYIGSHFGSTDDSYLGSSIRFQRAIKKRPSDFRRKILAYTNGDRKVLLCEEERWLQMIPVDKLQKTYYNVKRRGTGGHVTEGYNHEQRAAYIEKLKNRPGRGKGHYAARAVFCEGAIYETLTLAKKTMKFDPTRRIKSRKYADYYFVDEGLPTDEEIAKNKQQCATNRRKCIDAMKRKNLSLTKEEIEQRIKNSHNTRRENGFLWKKPQAERKGRRIVIDDVEYANLWHASTTLNTKNYFLRKRANDPSDQSCYFPD